jgi:hypothetical protein
MVTGQYSHVIDALPAEVGVFLETPRVVCTEAHLNTFLHEFQQTFGIGCQYLAKVLSELSEYAIDPHSLDLRNDHRWLQCARAHTQLQQPLSALYTDTRDTVDVLKTVLSTPLLEDALDVLDHFHALTERDAWLSWLGITTRTPFDTVAVLRDRIHEWKPLCKQSVRVLPKHALLKPHTLVSLLQDTVADRLSVQVPLDDPYIPAVVEGLTALLERVSLLGAVSTLTLVTHRQLQA